jgi:tripeptidyl-peptidase-1
VEYTPQAYLPADLDMFFRNYSPSQVGERPILKSIDGGFLQTETESFDLNGESDLDLEYGMSLVYPQKVTLYQTGDYVEGASFNNFLDALDASYCTYDGGDDPTQDGVYPDTFGSGFGAYEGPEACGGFAATNVISTSYGYNEADLTPFYEMRQCHEYLKLGLQGVTFLYSSGDYGVAGNGGQCIDPATGQYNNGKPIPKSPRPPN